jgi:spore germination protein GerM
MSRNFRWTVMQKLFFSLWAMATLVLLFVVALLVRDIAANGRDPVGAFQLTEEEQAQRAPEATRSTSVGTREVLLYFSAPDGQSLATEKRVLTFSNSTVENCKSVLAALIEGPQTGTSPILPKSVKVKSLFLLEGGELVVNFSRELQSEHARFSSAALESLMVQGIVQSVAQSAVHEGEGPRVSRVRFLIEDAPPSEAFPAHIDLAEPVAPDAHWLSAQN